MVDKWLLSVAAILIIVVVGTILYSHHLVKKENRRYRQEVSELERYVISIHTSEHDVSADKVIVRNGKGLRLLGIPECYDTVTTSYTSNPETGTLSMEVVYFSDSYYVKRKFLLDFVENRDRLIDRLPLLGIHAPHGGSNQLPFIFDLRR